MEKTFYNLLDENFVPCDGRLESISGLLVKAHKIQDLRCSAPLSTLSIHRLLVAMLYRIFDIRTDKQWKDLWSVGKFSPEKIRAYVEKWHDRFWLVHPKFPFMQDVKVKGKAQSINKLKFLTDNDASLFTKDFIGSKSASAQEIALDLIMYQLMSVNSGKGLVEKRACFHESAQRGLAILISGQNLFQTLLLNTHTYNESLPENQDDMPIWEHPPGFVEDEVLVSGYSHYLTQPARRSLLIQNADNTFTSVISEKAHEPFGNILDPFVIYVPNEKPKPADEGRAAYWKTIQFSETQYLWRHFQSLSATVKERSGKVRFINNENVSLLDGKHEIFYRYFGMHMDSKLTKFKCVVEHGVPVRVQDLATDLSENIIKVVTEVNRIGQVLSGQLFNFYKEIGVISQQERWLEEFWASTNHNFTTFMAAFHVEPGTAVDNFAEQTRNQALQTFDNATNRLAVSNMTKYLEYVFAKGRRANFSRKVWNPNEE